MSNNNLGDHGASAFGGMLEETGYLKSLNLSENGFTNVAAKPLGQALVVNSELLHLDLSRNALGERSGTAPQLVLHSKGPTFKPQLNTTRGSR